MERRRCFEHLRLFFRMAACDAYGAQARNNLASTARAWTFGRDNSCAQSAYAACVHAAIAGLIQAGLAPSEPSQGWGPDGIVS
jgi:hypothetical protein